MRYFFLLSLVNLMWAFQFSGAKLATEQLGPITVAFLPMAMATLLLTPLLLFSRAGHAGAAAVERPGTISLIFQFVLLGALGPVAAQLFLVWGVALAPASNAAVINLTIPALTAVLALILLRERMTRSRWIAFGLAIAGVLIVSDLDWGSLQIFEGEYLLGNLLVFLSCCGSAFNNTYSKKLLRWFGPAEVFVYSALVADLILFGLMLRYEPQFWGKLAGLSGTAWLNLGAIALFSLSLSMLLFFWVIQRIDVTQASVSIYLLPVFGVIIAALTLKEKVTWQLIAGALLVFASTFLVTSYEERKKAAVYA